MAERLARGAHEAIAANKPYGAEDSTIVSIGLNEASFLDLMRQAGFRPVPDAAEGAPNWAFRGRPKARPPRPEGERRRRPHGDRPQGERPRGERPQGDGPQQGARPQRGDRPERKDRPERDERKGRPDRKPRPNDRDRGGERERDRGAREPRQIVATGKALAGLGALFGREE